MLAVDVDPVASLKIWSVDVITPVGTFKIPPLPANMWLIAIYESWGSFERIIDLLKYDDRTRLEDAVLEGRLEEGQLYVAVTEAITVAAGRPWWQAINLLDLLRGDWSRLHGKTLKGFDPARFSLAAYLDRAYSAVIELTDEKSRQKVDGFIETPSPGMKIELNEAQEGETFLAMLNSSR